MGLLDFFKKKPKAQEPKVSIKVIYRDADGNEIDTDSEEFRREQEEWERLERERKRAQEEEQAANRRFLSEAGVDVDSFTPERVISDAIALIDSVCPPMQAYRCDLRKSKPDIVFSSPTKTGKVPKNVVVAHMFHDEVIERPSSIEGFPHREYGDNLIAHLHYLADGSINMADIYGWHAHFGQGVIIRRFGDDHRIVEVKRATPKSEGVWTSLYKNPKPDSNDIGLEQLEKSVRHIFAR